MPRNGRFNRGPRVVFLSGVLGEAQSQRALALIGRVPLIDRPETLGPLEQETDELIKIFVASIRTASGRE